MRYSFPLIDVSATLDKFDGPQSTDVDESSTLITLQVICLPLTYYILLEGYIYL